MAVKVVKLAVLPAALGLASFRVYAMSEKKTDDMMSPQELSIYNPEPPVLQYVVDQPGHLQTGLGRVRVGLQPYVRTVQNACTSVQIGVTSLYQSGQDMYEFLRDPPPGFLPRVGVITVSGLAGLILARKGSRLKRIGFPLALTTVGAAVCYPRETVGVLKFTGKKVYTASSLVASVIKSKPKEDDVVPQTRLEPVTPNLETTTSKELLDSEPAGAIIGEGAAPVGEFAPELDVENVIEVEPALSEPAPIEEVTTLSDDVPQEGPTVSEVPPEVDVAPVEIVPHMEDTSKGNLATVQEEAIPVENIPITETVISTDVAATAFPSEVTSSEVREDLAPVSDVTLKEVTPVGEVEPVPDTLVPEVDVVRDVVSKEVTAVSESTSTEVIEISPEILHLFSEEVATVSEIDADPELPLTLEASSEVDTILLPNVAPEEVTQAAADQVEEVASVGVSPAALNIAAVDEAVSASALLVAELALEVAPKQDSETEASHEPTHVSECAPDSEASKPAAEVVLEATDSDLSELALAETKVAPEVPLLAEEPTTLSLSEQEEDIPLTSPPADIAASDTASEQTISLPASVEETSSLPPLDKGTTFCPSTTEEIVSVPLLVIDQPTLIADAVQETTSSPPAVEIAPTAPLSFATEDTTSPFLVVDEAISPPPAEEETTSHAAAEQIPALIPDSVKEKPRFVPDPSLVDHGQAHPEDADMYSTRG